MPVRAWWRHQGRNAVDQLQRCEVKLVHPGTTLVTAWLAMLFGATVHQGCTLLRVDRTHHAGGVTSRGFFDECRLPDARCGFGEQMPNDGFGRT